MKYVAPEMELVMFTNEDVIVASAVETTTTEEKVEVPDGGEWW